MELDVDQHSCPNMECPDFGKAGAGNIRIHCSKDRRLRCVTCNGRFSARQGTIFYNLKTDEEKVLLMGSVIHDAAPGSPGHPCPSPPES